MSKKLKFIIIAAFCTAVLLIVIAVKKPNPPKPINPNPNPAPNPSPLTSLTHDLQKGCENCHPPQKPDDEPVSKEDNSARILRICFQCHQDYSNYKGWVHGPVALGQCLVCHNFHEDQNNKFLKYPLPELCYQCHDSQDMASVENHSEPAYSNCNNCHLPHAGPEINRLKPNAAKGQTNAYNINNTVAPAIRPSRRLPRTLLQLPFTSCTVIFAVVGLV
jgi:predicted CXXCH cytochrome family protein